MSSIEVTGTEPVRKGGKACDYITFAVDPGREEVWVEAARMSGRVVDAHEHGQGAIRVRVERTMPDTPINPEKVRDGIGRTFHSITANPNPRPKSRRG